MWGLRERRNIFENLNVHRIKAIGLKIKFINTANWTLTWNERACMFGICGYRVANLSEGLRKWFHHHHHLRWKVIIQRREKERKRERGEKPHPIQCCGQKPQNCVANLILLNAKTKRTELVTNDWTGSERFASADGDQYLPASQFPLTLSRYHERISH